MRIVIIFTSVLFIALIDPSKEDCTLESEKLECEFKAECYGSTNTLRNELNLQPCTEKDVSYDYYNSRRRQYRTDRTYESVNLHLKLIDSHSSVDAVNNIDQLQHHIKSFVITKSNFTNVPTAIYGMSQLTDFGIIFTKMNAIKLNAFLGNTHLNKINASHNLIITLEEDGKSTQQSPVTTIDLSHNLIERIPDNNFLLFPKLQNLDISHNSISSFGILAFEGISQLESLQLSNNKLLQIGQSFVRFVKLKELYLDNNKLSIIDATNFATMAKLEKFNLSSNFLVHIDDEAFHNLKSLIELDLGKNKLAVISKLLLKHNSKLQTLVLSNNVIEFIESEAFGHQNILNFFIENNCLTGIIQPKTFQGIQVNSLNLSKGKITVLSSEAFSESQIQSLNLSSNLILNISQTTFIDIKDLHELDVSNNILTDVDFNKTDLSELVTFNAQNNNIKKITQKTFKNLKSLRQLDLSHNNISEMDALSFEDLSDLQILKLMYNNLSITVSPHVFSGLTAVTNIELAYTGIILSFQDHAFSGLSLLKTLNASHCQLANIDFGAFDNTGSLEILDLSFNLLEDLQLNTTSVSLLKNLYLNNNKITNIANNTFYGLSNLQELNLAHNKIVEVAQGALRFLNNLYKFDLSFNAMANFSGSILENMTVLSEVSLSNIKSGFNFERLSNASIKQLDLSGCNIDYITTMSVFRVKDIEKLNLSSNRLTVVDKSSFQEMSTLTLLDLSNNFIRNIQPGSFLHTNKITVLNLNHNELRSLQFGFLDGLKSLQMLNLSQNSLHDFSIHLLHTAPLISTLDLDDNFIEDVKFEDISQTNFKKICIGNNLIPCHILVELKNSNLSFNVTAQRLDFHNENVDGIKCTSGVLFNNATNSTGIFSNIIFIEMMNSIDNLRSTINEINNKNTSGDTDIKRDVLSIIEAVNKQNEIVQNNSHELQNNTKYLDKLTVSIGHFDQYLKNQTDIQKQQRTSLPYFNVNQNARDKSLQENIKILHEEKEKIVEEIKSVFEIAKNTKTDLKNYKAQPVTMNGNNNDEVYYLLVIIVVCLSVITLIFVSTLICSSLKSRKFSSYNNSTQPIVTNIEME